MIGINHVSNGKWYIENRNDLYDIYTYLNEFYSDTLKSEYGSLPKVRIKYDGDLQTLTVKWYKRGSIFGRVKRLLLLNDVKMFNRLKLLLETIVSRGKVNAPLSNIDIIFNANMKKKDAMRNNNYLINTSKLGDNKGYFLLKGKLL